MADTQVDFIHADGSGGLSGSGPVAHRLLQSGFNVNSLRTCDVLRKDEWSQLDNALLEVGRKRLVAVNELMSRGLRYNINNGLGTTILEWEQVSDMEPAEESMSGVKEGERDRFDFTLQSMPLPIIHKDFEINARALEASRTRGQPLDTAQAEMASRLVSERVESMVFNGSDVRIGSSQIYGLATHPDRNTGSVTANWDATATTGQNKLDDTIAIIDAMIADNMYGPYGLFVTATAYNLLADDYKTDSDKTQLQRLLEVPGIEFIQPSKDVPAGAVLATQLTRDVIDEVVGLEPTIVQWESHGGMKFHFKVMSIMVPRIRSTYTGQSGVMHLS